MSDQPASSNPNPPSKSPTSHGWEIAVGVAFVLLAWFAIANSDSVRVHFWVTSVRAPVVVVIALSALLGVLILALWRRARPKH